MNKLLYKELKLSITKFFYIMPFLTGALFLIPQWPYFIALMYFFFISVPNILSTYNSQNDFGFSIMMPVSKKEIVKGKILTFVTLELLHLLIGAFFAILNVKSYGGKNFFMDLSPAFFGLAFIMFGLFNLVLFPLYFKTAYNFGVPVIMANITALLYVSAVEFIFILNNTASKLFEGNSAQTRLIQPIVLIGGIILFTLLNMLAYLLSYRRFEKIDL